MTPTSPGVHAIKKGITRNPELLKDPKILSAVVPASKLGIKKDSLYLEELYNNPIAPIEYGTSLLVNGDISSTIEVGLHIVATALEKQHWACVVDSRSHASSSALFESATTHPRFVCVRSFSPTKFSSVVSHLVSSMRVVVAHVPTALGAQHMARIMARVRENDSIVVLLDPAELCHASCDRQIKAQTLSFQGLNKGAGAILKREMKISEYKHGMRVPDHLIKRYA